MARNFPDFLSAYFEYARDGYCPDRFHKWVGLSIVAAAVERKISLMNGRVHRVPNLYVMLVSHPAVGKTTAMGAGVDLLETLKEKHNVNFRIIPNQITEPAFVKLMNIIDRYQIPGTTIALPQSAGFFYASEASASALQNTFGNFTATMTEFYDCPKKFRKDAKVDPSMTVIENACMNLLAGSTFDYLKTLVNDQSVLGGFASRLTYVVEDERRVKETKWGASQEFDSRVARALVEDLAHINKLIGPMKPTDGFKRRWEEWKPKFDQYLIDLKSERMESIMARKGTCLEKVSMLLSISEGDSLILTEDHFDRALELVEDVYKDNAMIIASAAVAQIDTQKGTNQLIMQTLKKNGGKMPKSALYRAVAMKGNGFDLLTRSIDGLLIAGNISINSSSVIELHTDPNSHL